MSDFHRRRDLAGRDPDTDALLVSHPLNVTYLTGFTGEASWLVLGGNGRAVLVSDGRFTQQVAEECPGLEVVIRPADRTLHQAVANTLTGLGFRRVAVEASHLTLADLETLRGLAPAVAWASQSGRVETLRRVKDADEIAAIRQAIAVAERAFAGFRALLRPADSEKTLADDLEAYLRRAGARCAAFPPIVAAGERSALPHAPPTARPLAGAGFVLVDWGAAAPLYHSDLTRMLQVGDVPPGRIRLAAGRVETTLASLYTVVREAQQAAIAAVRPGVAARAVDAAAREVIARAGLGDYFTHGLGHGLGLAVHEAPAVRANTDDVLEAGNVITIEPGVYLPGAGGVRIEDDILVTPDGHEVLTALPRDPAELAV
jgi:Xaa-Pro aminopeptidase